MGKYKVTRIYANMDDVRVNRKLEEPKNVGTYLGVDASHAIKRASENTGVYVDCMTAELAKESK
jgi:hypothetical protein